MKTEVRVTSKEKKGSKCSVRIEMPEGRISINDIFVREIEGKLRITFPLSRDRHPNVYLHGELKQEVDTAIAKAYYQSAAQGTGA